MHKEISFEEMSKEAISLLKQLIATPSFSKEEDQTAELIFRFLETKGVAALRQQNNVWARNKFYSASLPTILLNSHHDTVKPNAGYTLDPFEPLEKDGKLFGLGSNDAGGALVALLMTFLYFYDRADLTYNLIFAATAEEEISGKNGIESLLGVLGTIDLAIVGEPTDMNLAVAEKGLLVLDCTAHGTSSHAAHDHPDNAIYKAMRDMEWFRDFRFPKTSGLLGEVKMNVTMINAGLQHNIIPDRCVFTVDIRTTDAYSNSEVLEIVKSHVACEVQPRSLRLNPSSINIDHPFVQAGISLGRSVYGSPTISDQALMPFSSVKIGPGSSPRSHSSDEFIFTDEIRTGIELYIKMLSKLMIHDH